MSLLIDGYNLLHALGWIDPAKGPKALERARLALVRFLGQSLSPDELSRTTVVFDASGAVPHAPQALRCKGLTVRFAAGYASADDLMEELIRAEPSPRSLVVVSSDRRIQRAARRRKARALDCETWYEQAANRRTQGPGQGASDTHSPARAESPLPEDEVEFWLRQFGGEIPAKRHDPEDPFPPGYADDLGPD